jgi:hypothetical protein
MIPQDSDLLDKDTKHMIDYDDGLMRPDCYKYFAKQTQNDEPDFVAGRCYFVPSALIIPVVVPDFPLTPLILYFAIIPCNS